MADPAVAPPPGRIAIVDESGAVSTVDARDVAAAVDEGARVASPAELREARLQAEYGGLGGQAAAAGAGVARGLTLGASDVIASAVGGEGVRRSLEGWQTANPLTSLAGEAVGTIAPVVASGGTGALARGVAAAGAAPRLAAGAGRLAGRGVAAALGEGTTAAGRIARSALEHAITGGVEASLYGAGQAASEAALGDHELTAEQLLASMGHAAAFGGVLSGGTMAPFAALGEAGSALAGAGKRAGARLRGVIDEATPQVAGAITTGVEAAEAAAAKAPGAIRSAASKLDEKASALLPTSEELQRLSDENAWRATYARKAFTEKADKFHGGSDGVGRVLKETGVIRPEDGTIANAIAPEELLERIQGARERVGSRLGQMADASRATVKAGDIVAEVERVIEPLRGIAGREGVVTSLETYRDSLIDKLALRSPKGRLLVGKSVPLQDLRAQRLGLQDIVFKEAKALDPGQRVDALRDMRRAFGDLETNALVAEGANAQEIATLKRHYGGLKLAEEATADAVSRGASNRSVGATDYLAFIGGGGGVAGAGLALANKIARERGSAALSVFLEDLAKTRSIGESVGKLGGQAADHLVGIEAQTAAGMRATHALNEVAKATEGIRGQVRDGVRGFMAGAKATGERAAGETRTAARALGEQAGSAARKAKEVRQTAYVKAFTSVDNYQRKKKDVEAMATPGRVEQRATELFGPLSKYAPSVAAQLAAKLRTSADYLERTRPKEPLQKGLFPFAKPPKAARLTPDEAAWMRRVRAVENPLTLIDDLKAGTLTPEAVEAVQETAPSLLADIRKEAVSSIQEMATNGERMSIDSEVTLAMLLDVETEYTSPEFLAAVQASKQPPAPREEQAAAGAAPSRPINIKQYPTEGERIET